MRYTYSWNKRRGGIFPLFILIFLLLWLVSCSSLQKKSQPATALTSTTPIKTASLDIIEKGKKEEKKKEEATAQGRTTMFHSSDSAAKEKDTSQEALPASPQSYQKLTSTPQKEKPLFDIPIVMNPLVENFIKYYQTTGRKQFSIWLARSERYIPMMRKVLKEHGLPTDLVYLAMIESGFNPMAYSRSRASGPWQFISGTGRKYGLKVNYWIDERRDPEKSTVAAARYLKDLYDQFESWHLAAAAYNCGEGKLNRAIKRYKTEDYWQLIKHHYLKRETRFYVPQMIAAALIAKEPEKYGFTDIQYQEPLKYERAVVPGGVTLRDIAKACKCQEQTLRILNPELIRRCTPPYLKRYEVKIPEGTKQILAKNIHRLKPVVKSTPNGWVRTHIVRRGDTLYELSLKYKVRVRDIRYLNHIRGNLLRIGQRLFIPAGRVKKRKIARRRRKRHYHPATSSIMAHRIIETRNGKFKEIVYEVRKGDNLWLIARRFNIHVKDICKLNPHISKHTPLHPKDKLKLRVPMAKFSSLPLSSRQAVQ